MYAVLDSAKVFPAAEIAFRYVITLMFLDN
jgi:hypothetical protein